MDDMTTEKSRQLRQMSNAQLRELLRKNACGEQEDEALTEAILSILDARPDASFALSDLREDFNANYRDLQAPLYPVELPDCGGARPPRQSSRRPRRYVALSLRVLGRAALVAILACSLVVAACAASIDVREVIVELIVTHVSAAGTPPTPEEIADGVRNFSGFVRFIRINLF